MSDGILPVINSLQNIVNRVCLELEPGDELLITYSVEVVRDGVAISGEGDEKSLKFTDLSRVIKTAKAVAWNERLVNLRREMANLESASSRERKAS